MVVSMDTGSRCCAVSSCGWRATAPYRQARSRSPTPRAARRSRRACASRRPRSRPSRSRWPRRRPRSTSGDTSASCRSRRCSRTSPASMRRCSPARPACCPRAAATGMSYGGAGRAQAARRRVSAAASRDSLILVPELLQLLVRGGRARLAAAGVAQVHRGGRRVGLARAARARGRRQAFRSMKATASANAPPSCA